MNYSDLVITAEQCWRSIQKKHPEVPECVVLVASGGRRAPTLLGHFASNTWSQGDKQIHEVLLVAEQLNRPAREVFQTLLHEAVHGIAQTRGVKDVSGRRHNKKFAKICEEVGLVPPVKPKGPLGFSDAKLREDTEQEYEQEIKQIADVLFLYRNLKFNEEDKPKNSWAAVCLCPRKIRVGKKIYNPDEDNSLRIICEDCVSPFVVEEE